MRDVLIVTVAVLLISILLVILPKQEGVWINCGLSEISPDFTNEMRLACRKARTQ
jgi:hypothetical protein